MLNNEVEKKKQLKNNKKITQVNIANPQNSRPRLWDRNNSIKSKSR
jgi:hypothetical protein